jgi:hypothetical protein
MLYFNQVHKFSIKTPLYNTQYFYIAGSDVDQQYSQNALLLFHGNKGYVNAPRFCIILVLCILFIPAKVVPIYSTTRHLVPEDSDLQYVHTHYQPTGLVKVTLQPRVLETRGSNLGRVISSAE